MSKIYSASVVGFKVGYSSYYIGNSFLDCFFPDFVPPISILQECKPYGFVGHPERQTSTYLVNDVVIGYLDTRSPFKSDTLLEGGCMMYTPSTSIVVNKESIGIYSLDTSMVITESTYDIQVQGSITAESQESILLKVGQSVLDMQQAVNKWGCGAGLIATPSGVAYTPDVSTGSSQDGMAQSTPLKSILNEMLDTFTLMVSWMNSHSHPNNGAPPSTPFILPTYWNTTYPTDISNLSTMP